MRLNGGAFVVTVTNEYRAATRAPAGFNVTPTISDKEAFLKAQPGGGGGLEQHARRGLATATTVGVVMVAHAKFVDRKRRGERLVDRLNPLGCLNSSRHIRLVGHDNKAEPRLAQPPLRLVRARDNLQFPDARG